MKVNGQPADPGCYIDGHWGQYGVDRVADVAEQFGLKVSIFEDPREWRKVAEGEEPSAWSPEYAWDRHVETSDTLEQHLNDATEGGYWTWEDGEFFLFQTEVEGMIYVPVEDDEEYDDAWRHLVEEGPGGCIVNYDDIQRGVKAFTFRCTITYEPEEQ